MQVAKYVSSNNADSWGPVVICKEAEVAQNRVKFMSISGGTYNITSYDECAANTLSAPVLEHVAQRLDVVSLAESFRICPMVWVISDSDSKYACVIL